MSAETALIEIALTEVEQTVLNHGINQWFGPASLSDELAVAMGFTGRADLFEQGVRLRGALAKSERLSALDWARILVMTEFVFASNVFGAGLDWPIVVPITDDETIQVLRELQRKFLNAGVGRPQLGPSEHQEFGYQRSAATSIRLFRAGRSSADKLLKSLDQTIESFGADLDSLTDLRTQLVSAGGRATSEEARDDALVEALNDFVEELRSEPERETRGFWF